jgi:DNA primase
MPGLIPPEFVEELLARTDLSELIGGRVTLKKAGLNYTGLCPFHNEKTPSFSVNADKQFYHCFGCQANGDAISFIREMEGVDFVGAIEQLADRIGMTVPREKADPVSEARHQMRKSIYDVLEQATEWYQVQLREGAGRQRCVDYLKDRGLTGAICRDYGVGFAPPGWDNLVLALAHSNQERQLLIDAGMLVLNEDEDRVRDRFRDRVMFPIRDLRGRVIAFGGRILGDGRPKYLNSPETPVFHKGRELYGLFEARKAVRKLTRFLVVEGYMDVVALAQHGIGYSVATLGTATSEDHLIRLFRLVPEIVFCFDGDQAGRNAAWKAVDLALGQLEDGRSARFLFLPDGEDPDSFVRAVGPDAFEVQVDQAAHLADFFFAHMSEAVDMDSLEGKARLSKETMPYINRIPGGVYRQLMVDRLAALTGLSPERLVAATIPPPAPSRELRPPTWVGDPDSSMDDAPPWDNEGFDPDPADGVDFVSKRGRLQLDHEMIQLLLWQPELGDLVSVEVVDRLESGLKFPLSVAVLKLLHQSERPSPDVIIGHFEGKDAALTLRDLARSERLLGVDELQAEFEGVVARALEQVEIQTIQKVRSDILTKDFALMTDDEKKRLREITESRKPR